MISVSRFSGTCKRSFSHPTFLMIVLLTCVAAFGMHGIDRSPVVWCDEVFYAEPARHFSLTGVLASPIFFDVRGLDSNFFLHPPLFFMIMGLIFKVLGFSQYVVRLPQLFFHLVSVYLVYRILKNLLQSESVSPYWAVLGSFLFAFDNSIFAEARSGRSGSLAILFMLLSYLFLTKPKLNIYFTIWFSSLFAGIAALTHPAGSALIVGYVLNVFLNRSYKGFRFRLFCCLFLGLAVCFVPYAASVASNLNVWENQFIAHVRGAILEHYNDPLTNFIREFRFKPFVLILGVLALVTPNKRIYQSALIPFIGLTILIFSRTSLYKFWIPFYYINVLLIMPFSLKYFGFNSTWKVIFKGLIAICCINILLHPMARSFTIQATYELRDPFPIEQLLTKFVPTQSRVLGPPSIYYLCAKHQIDFRYPSPLYMIHISNTREDEVAFQSAVKKYKPEFLILSNSVIPEDNFKFLEKVSFEKLGSYFADVRTPTNTEPIDLVYWKVRYEE